MIKKIGKIFLSGAEVYPLVEGGKGIGVSNGTTAGAFAAAGAVGTISGVCPPAEEVDGSYYPVKIKASSRRERSKEIIRHSIEASIREINRAAEISSGNGRIHLNILWGIAGAEEIIISVLKRTKGMVHGVTCGAGMPYRLAGIAREFGVFYYPIVSSDRAFNALWSRAFNEVPELLGGVVYEDPWKAGGHNGLSTKENPMVPESNLGRVTALRKAMQKAGLAHVPIIVAGGIWNLSEYEEWIDNPLVGPVAFQLGTRPLLTRESPIPEAWKRKLVTIKKGEVILNKYSSTGFYSSAINNEFLRELEDRSSRQIPVKEEPDSSFEIPFLSSARKLAYVTQEGMKKAETWMLQGFRKILPTPDETLLFVSEEKARQIRKDQRDCKGCLVACKFSGWSINEDLNFTTGVLPDPRSFCILNTLTNALCGEDIEHELLFSGHNTYRFSEDPLYRNNYIPTIRELIGKLLQGE